MIFVKTLPISLACGLHLHQRLEPQPSEIIAEFSSLFEDFDKLCEEQKQKWAMTPEAKQEKKLNALEKINQITSCKSPETGTLPKEFRECKKWEYQIHFPEVCGSLARSAAVVIKKCAEAFRSGTARKFHASSVCCVGDCSALSFSPGIWTKPAYRTGSSPRFGELRVLRTLTTLRNLQNPASLSFPTLHGFLPAEGGADVLLEFMEGVTLKDFLLEEHSAGEVFCVLKKFLAAYKHFNAAGFSHGDLHTGSVFVTPKFGDCGDVKIFDFYNSAKIDSPATTPIFKDLIFNKFPTISDPASPDI